MRDRGGSAAVKSRGRVEAPDVSTMGLSIDAKMVAEVQAMADRWAFYARQFISDKCRSGGMFGGVKW